MTNRETTRPVPRAAQAIEGARAAERHLARTSVIARQLEQIAPGTITVRTVPMHSDRDGTPRRAMYVVLAGTDGRPVGADREAHRAARGLLARMFPGADWTRPLIYDARSGGLAIDEPIAPIDLGLDDQEPRR